ncbi:MAG TPA: FAD-dependent monooxygenase [Caldimonas sp.]|nr:FAD-dependent monooxygenase [Caldimonas sp.]
MHDVVILGGGLAGLTLALQLKQRVPDLDVLVLERRAHPVPVAAHKVGESSVEIGANYLGEVLGLASHLERTQLKKFGFRFFFSDGAAAIDRVTELGASRYLSTPSYQIDRGILENDLARMAHERGVRFLDGATVRTFDVGDAGTPHAIRYANADGAHEVRARWLVDASGRAGLLKRKLGLADGNSHDANAVWFRIGARIDVNAWSNDDAWRSRCDPPDRWLSTNHLVGEGYWVWLIPLASGSHSVGIVADEAHHPLETLNTFEKSMAWLAIHQPQLHAELERHRERLQDFAFFRRFSYGCQQVYDGARRWALTGEAGLFLDPFYSPGGDFIAISNTYVTDLVARDRTGSAVASRADVYQRIYFSFYDAMLPIYTGQYGLFGDPEVLPAKVLWDYTYYWGVLCQLFFQRRLTDLAAIGRLQKPLVSARDLNVGMQAFFRAWSARSDRRNPARLLDQASLPWFAELNRGLTDRLDDGAFDRRMAENFARLEALAVQIVARARADHRELASPAADGRQVPDPTTGEGPSLLFEDA